MKEVLIKEIWDEFRKIWSTGMTPHRPSQDELEIYEDFLLKSIRKIKKPRALILGATPELRDLLYEHKIETWLIDINPNMIRGMDELLEVSDGKEKKIIGDWLKMPLPENHFDVVLGDHVLNNVRYEKWDIFFQNIKKVLKPGGHLIKSTFTMEKDEAIDIESVVPILQNQIVSMQDKFYYLHRSLANLRDIKNSRFFKDLNEIQIRLEKMKDKKIISKDELDFLLEPRDMYEFFKMVVPFKEEVDKFLNKHFIFKTVRNPWSHPMLTLYKIYYCQKKK